MNWLRRGRVLAPAHRPVAGSLASALYSQAVLVVTGVLVARSLGPIDRGYLALLVLIPTVLQQVGTLGVPLATTYFLARDRALEASVFRMIRGPAVAQAFALTALQAAILWVLVGSRPDRVWIAGIATLPFLAGGLSDMYGKAILLGQGRFTAWNVLRAGPVTFYLLGLLVLVAIGIPGLTEVAIVWMSSNVAGGLLTLSLALRGRNPPEPREVEVSRRQLFRFGFRGFLGAASPVDTFRLDQALIGLFLPPKALGLYVAGLAFTNLPHLISRSIGMIALPQVARKGGTNDDVWGYVLFSAGLTAVIIAALEVTAGWLVPLFFGQDFSEAVTLTRILLLSSLFLGVRRVLSDSVSGTGRPGLGSLAEVVSWIFLIPLLGVMLPLWGAEGVASALVVTSGISLGIFVLMLRRFDDRPPSRVLALASQSPVASEEDLTSQNPGM